MLSNNSNASASEMLTFLFALTLFLSVMLIHEMVVYFRRMVCRKIWLLFQSSSSLLFSSLNPRLDIPRTAICCGACGVCVQCSEPLFAGAMIKCRSGMR